MTTSKASILLGLLVGTFGALYVGFAIFGTALVALNEYGLEIFAPYVFLLATLAFIASAIIVRYRAALFVLMSAAYALRPLEFSLWSRSWLLLHSFSVFAILGGIALGAVVLNLAMLHRMHE